jgi:hypothetical protein
LEVAVSSDESASARAEAEDLPAGGIDTTAPQSARIWNYWLGGKDNYPVDREAGDAFAKLFPGIGDEARAARYYLARTVRYLAGEAGIRQFLDVGTGLPNVDNTHEIAQRVAPESRVVYVDNDPLVLAHARALLTSTAEGATHYIDADIHDPEAILRAASQFLDFTRPTALILMGILGHVADFDEARSIVRTLMGALPSGSYLAHDDSTNTNQVYNEATRMYNEESGGVPYILRSPEQLARLYDGLELVEPGVVMCTQWRPDPGPFGEPPIVNQYGGVGRKT